MISQLMNKLIGLLLLNLLFNGNSIAANLPLRAPSVFRADEIEMHRYSAVLAATEPFRQQCQRQLQKALNPLQILAGKLKGKSIFDQGVTLRNLNTAVDEALTKFELRMQTIVQSYGMSIQQFNSASSVINEQKSLKKRVLLQAYLYKIAADLEMNLKKAMPILPSIGRVKETQLVKTTEQSLENGRATQSLPTEDSTVSKENDASATSPSPYYTMDTTATLTKRFAKSLRKIEHERLKIRNHLKRTLNIRELPPRIADPEYLPAMAPIIQRSCQEFPQIVTEIIERNGLHIEEFNSMQQKLRNNFFFRYQVMKELDQLDKRSPGVH